MRFESTGTFVAILAAALLSGCSHVPWRAEVPNEVNLAIRIDKNLPHVRFQAGGVRGDGIVSTRHHQTIISSSFADRAAPSASLMIGDLVQLRGQPLVADIGGAADALLGRDLWKSNVLTFDWRRGLLIVQSRVRRSDDAIEFSWEGQPAIDLVVDGSRVRAIVDTTSPEGLVLPGASAGRRSARIEVGGATMTAPVVTDPRAREARLGNQVLSRFLLQIDYGRRVVRLWPY